MQADTAVNIPRLDEEMITEVGRSALLMWSLLSLEQGERGGEREGERDAEWSSPLYVMF
jgi:hypothetical protein